MRVAGYVLALCLCATLFVSLPAQTACAQEAKELAYGRQLYQAGESDRALSVLRNFVQRSGDDSSADSTSALTLIGRILTRQQNYQNALLYLNRIPQSLRSDDTNLLIGRAQIGQKQFDKGRELLQPLLDAPLDISDRMSLLQSLSDAAEQQQDYVAAVYYLHKQYPLSNNPAKVLTHAHAILQNSIGDNALAELAFMLQATEIGQDARMQLARRALARQQQQEAQRQLAQLFDTAVMFPYWQEAQQLSQRANARSWVKRDSIGVMLPLSGRYASYGELVKTGLDLALQEHNKTRLPMRFVYKDTGSDTSPEQLVSSLANDDKVMAIIGPLQASNAIQAARAAQNEMVPLLALSQSDALPEIGNYIFRDTLTARQQVKALIDHALAEGHRTFSILHPSNRLGQKMTDLFVQELELSGGEIVDILDYSEDSVDFKQQVHKLLRVVKNANTPEEEEEEYPPAPFDALFIPDYADRITLVAPQLMFYGLKDVTLLGINGWNSPELINRSGRFLRNAVFVDAFFAKSRKPEVKRFVELYRQSYDAEPSILDAQAFEVASVLLKALDDPAVINREELRRRLLSIRNFAGITGTHSFDYNGEAVKELTLLKVRKGEIIEN